MQSQIQWYCGIQIKGAPVIGSTYILEIKNAIRLTFFENWPSDVSFDLQALNAAIHSEAIRLDILDLERNEWRESDLISYKLISQEHPDFI